VEDLRKPNRFLAHPRAWRAQLEEGGPGEVRRDLQTSPASSAAIERARERKREREKERGGGEERRERERKSRLRACP
jgi:hypothetical protein